MILPPRCSHSQHRSHVARVAQLSPPSPQLWITPVYKHVNNLRRGVRFARNVRLSPPVDDMWTEICAYPMQQTSRCGHPLRSCAQTKHAPTSSPTIHHNPGSGHTHSPQTHITGLRVIRALIHTFHTTDDDEYIHRSMNPHTNNDTATVDDSRTVSTRGSSPSVKGSTHLKTTKYKGGHE